jgi:hypothetical protein
VFVTEIEGLGELDLAIGTSADRDGIELELAPPSIG